MLKLPNPPWYRRWSVILAAVIVLAAGMATLGLRGLQEVANPSTTTAATGPVATVPPEPPTTRPAVVQPSPSTTRAPPGVLWQAEGSDTHRSRLFRAPQSWRIVWSFDCSEFAGGQGGNFKLSGEGAFEEVLIQEFDVRASGSRSVTGGGFGRLVVTSVCEHWEVRAVRA
jgi:hypothetical protein